MKTLGLLGILLVAALMLGACSDSNIAGEGKAKAPRIVAANSCDADEQCEVNTISFPSGGSISSNEGMVKIESIPGRNLQLTSDNNVQVDGPLYVESTVTFNSQLIQMSNIPTTQRYSGSNFLCIDGTGVIYRSDEPCTGSTGSSGITKQEVLNTLNGCIQYSVSVPDENRDVRGNDICEERNAGTCIFTIAYEQLNEAVNSEFGGLSGSNAGVIQSCSWGPYPSTSTTAMCCR